MIDGVKPIGRSLPHKREPVERPKELQLTPEQRELRIMKAREVIKSVALIQAIKSIAATTLKVGEMSPEEVIACIQKKTRETIDLVGVVETRIDEEFLMVIAGYLDEKDRRRSVVHDRPGKQVLPVKSGWQEYHDKEVPDSATGGSDKPYPGE